MFAARMSVSPAERNRELVKDLSCRADADTGADVTEVTWRKQLLKSLDALEIREQFQDCMATEEMFADEDAHYWLHTKKKEEWKGRALAVVRFAPMDARVIFRFYRGHLSPRTFDRKNPDHVRETQPKICFICGTSDKNSVEHVMKECDHDSIVALKGLLRRRLAAVYAPRAWLQHGQPPVATIETVEAILCNLSDENPIIQEWTEWNSKNHFKWLADACRMVWQLHADSFRVHDRREKAARAAAEEAAANGHIL